MDLFIPYEEAKALNNEDYDKVTRFGQDASLYDEDGDHVFYANYGFMGSGLGEGYIPAPTWDEVFTFFREKYELHAEPVWDYPPINDNDILKGVEEDVHWCFVVTLIGYLGDDKEVPTKWYKTYEEARLEALRIMIKEITI